MKWIRNIIVLLFVMGMVAAAMLTGEREIIFPEILALAAGAWVADRQPWRVGRLHLVALMTVGSLAGVLLVRYVPMPLLLQVLAAFLFAAALLLLSRTTLVPLLSACILPVLLQTRSWVYPLAVLVLTGCVAGVQYLLERTGVRPARPKAEERPALRTQLRQEGPRWAGVFAGVALLGIAAVWTGWTFLIAPPLLVAYTELSNVYGKPRTRPVTVLLLLVSAAWAGTFFRLMVCEGWGLPLWLGAGLSTLFVLCCFAATGMIFPPAGAMALLPMLLDVPAVRQFPIQATVGCVLLMGAALLQFRQPKAAEEPSRESSELPAGLA